MKTRLQHLILMIQKKNFIYYLQKESLFNKIAIKGRRLMAAAKVSIKIVFNLILINLLKSFST